jgi:FtsX-like permease family/MacB-like periplasmic core domain
MPDWKPEIRQRLANLKLEPTREAAIIEELAQYLEDYDAELRSSGATEGEAYQRILAELNGSELLARELRRVERPGNPEPIVPGTNRRTNMIADLWQDVRSGARMILKSPGFTLITALTLALGIGSNITIFSVVNAALLRPLPYPEAEQLVFLWSESPQRNIKERASAWANVADWRNQSQSFAEMAVFDPTVVTLTGAAEPEQVVSVGASANLFLLLGVAPLLGRTFTADEEQQRVVVLSYGLWRRRFGASPDIVGHATVVGVVGDMRRQSLERQSVAQMFLPHAQSPSRRMNLLIRTTPEPTQLAAVVRNEIRTLDQTIPLTQIATLESQFAASGAQRRFQTWLLTLFSALALLLAAVGIFGVMRQSVALRTRELGTRLALGAQPRDVLWLVIGQGMRFALCGIGIGLLAALGLTRVLTGLLFGVTATDPTTFITAPLLLLLVALLACWIPARRATKVDPLIALRSE